MWAWIHPLSVPPVIGIPSNVCPYCGGPYLLSTGGCKCYLMTQVHRMVREAALADVTELDEVEGRVGHR